MVNAGDSGAAGFTRASRLWLVVLAFLGLGAVHAQNVSIVTGEYSPFVAQRLPQHGVTAAIVTKAFKSQGLGVNYEFLPWKRGYNETLLGTYVASFPYLKTAEREVLFLYSEPICTDRFRLFVRKSQVRQQDWAHKRLCIPLGYDTTQVQGFTMANAIVLERPSESGNCFQMLERERVDAVWVSELVAADTVRAMFGADAKTYALDISLVGEHHYYLIVSKALPDFGVWVSKFNAGLKHIQGNGTYKKIVKQFGGN